MRRLYEILAEYSTDGIILFDADLSADVVMSKMGGTALFSALKERQPKIRMVVMSGYPQRDKERSLLKDPAVYWIQKPFQVSKIVEKIKEAFLEIN